MPSSPIVSHPTLRALVVIVLFTYTAQNMLNASIAPLSRELAMPEWVIGATLSLAAATVAALSQFWGRRSVLWGPKRVIVCALICAAGAGALFSGAVWAAQVGWISMIWAAIAIMCARGPLFGAAVAAIPPTGQVIIASITPDQQQRVKGMAMASGAISTSIMVGSLLSSALGTWSIVAPAYATPWFVVIALGIAVIWMPADSRSEIGKSNEAGALEKTLPPRVHWWDRRVFPWIAGAFGTFFTAGVAQILMGFILQDRLGISPGEALPLTALMLGLNALGGILMQLVVVPRLGWSPRRLLRFGATLGLAGLGLLAIAPSALFIGCATFMLGVSLGIVGPGFQAGGSLAVSAEEQGGVAGVLHATGAVTWIFAPISSTALYSVQRLSPFILSGVILAVSCAFAWCGGNSRARTDQ
ncbi:MAG: MFS transporter [Actinomycetaceae bacterium]|nr:MFS transporter [Actinomycetaceae bacterium]